jgi:hypothetical protein
MSYKRVSQKLSFMEHLNEKLEAENFNLTIRVKELEGNRPGYIQFEKENVALRTQIQDLEARNKRQEQYPYYYRQT